MNPILKQLQGMSKRDLQKLSAVVDAEIQRRWQEMQPAEEPAELESPIAGRTPLCPRGGYGADEPRRAA
jgi:hypothetical protein